MFVIDEAPIKEDAFNTGISQILRITGFKPARFPDGRLVFVSPTQNGNFNLIENVGHPEAGPLETVWVGARTDAQGRGFRMDRAQTFQKAMVSSFKLKDPTYSRGLDSDFEVAEAHVSEERESAVILERLLTDEPTSAFAPR